MTLRFILFMLCILLPASFFAQKTAFVVLNPQFRLSDIPQLKNMLVEINGKKITGEGKRIRFELHKTGIDTVMMLFGDSTKRIISTHFKPGETYTIRFNPCSLYEIMPVKHKERPETQVRIVLRNRPDSTWVVAGTNEATYLITPDAFNNTDSTHYLESASIGYCPFSSRHFFVCSGPLTSSRPEEAVEYSDAHWEQCKAPVLQFLCNERYSIIYDFRTKTYSVTFDGSILDQ